MGVPAAQPRASMLARPMLATLGPVATWATLAGCFAATPACSQSRDHRPCCLCCLQPQHRPYTDLELPRNSADAFSGGEGRLDCPRLVGVSVLDPSTPKALALFLRPANEGRPLQSHQNPARGRWISRRRRAFHLRRLRSAGCRVKQPARGGRRCLNP